VDDLDGEVFAFLTEDLLELFLEDLARTVVRVDDMVVDLELDDLGDRLEVLQQLLVLARLRNGVLPSSAGALAGSSFHVRS